MPRDIAPGLGFPLGHNEKAPGKGPGDPGYRYSVLNEFLFLLLHAYTSVGTTVSVAAPYQIHAPGGDNECIRPHPRSGTKAISTRITGIQPWGRSWVPFRPPIHPRHKIGVPCVVMLILRISWIIRPPYKNCILAFKFGVPTGWRSIA